MRGFETYKKLRFWIDLLEQEIAVLKIKQKEVEKRISKGPKDYSSPQYTQVKVDMKYKDPYPSETAFRYYIQLEEEIKLKEIELKKLKVRERKIDELINSMDHAKYKVAYLREIKGLSLYEIAQELGYSEGHIKNISMEVSRELENLTNM